MSLDKHTTGKILMNAKSITSRVPSWAWSKLFFATQVLRFQNGVLHAVHLSLYRKSQTDTRTILVFRTGSLGDSLCAIPAIQAIKKQYPYAAVDILTNTGASNLVGLHNLLEKELYREIINYFEYPRKKLFQLLRQKKYDLVVQLPQVDASFFSLLRDMIIFRLIASSGVGWYKSQIKWFRKAQATYLVFDNEIDRLSAILQRYHIAPVILSPILRISEAELLVAKKVLNESGLRSFDKMITIVVGAKRAQNRWPIAYFKQVIEHFATRFNILLIGSNDENQLVAPLLNIKNVINLCGKLTPLQSAAAISLSRLTISNDTGPMHLSYGVGTATIAIFSSRDLGGKWYPPANSNFVFRAKDIPCQGCFSETCSNNICMQAIKPIAVINCAEQLLK